MSAIVVSMRLSIFVCVIVNHLLRGTNDRNKAAQIVEYTVDARENPGIGDMGTIPCQQVIDMMMRSRGDMKSVNLCFRWQNRSRHDLLCNSVNLRSKLQQRDAIQFLKAFLGQDRVAIGR